jgi:hypothetical protein
MKTLFSPLVDWGMGSFVIGVFALVCIILIAFSAAPKEQKMMCPKITRKTSL